MTNKAATDTERNEEPSEQALLAEYQTCEQDSNAIGSQYWIPINILIGLNMVFFGFVAHGIIEGNRELHEVWPWLIIGLIMATLISIFICLLLRRMNYLNQIDFYRMREIEVDQKLWKNRIIDYLDNFNDPKEKKYANCNDRKWNKLSEKDKGWLDQIGKRYKTPPKGKSLECFLYIIILTPWILTPILLFIFNC